MNTELKVWSDRLGILPVNFLHNQNVSSNVYALLDGARNNFCLAFNYDYNEEQTMNRLWSANMSSYVLIKGKELYLYNILRGNEPQRIDYTRVLRDMPTFKSYLGKLSLAEQDTIVPFVMEHFRIIRSELREEDSAANSLKVFLYIVSQLGGMNIEWKLPPDTLQAVKSIKRDGLLEETIHQMKNGTVSGLKPDVDMILRHCAGQLFQEANYMAQFSPQLELFATANYQTVRSRRQVGSYFTPLYIARSIVEETLKKLDAFNRNNLVIFDPACGSGVFLVEALRQLRSGGYLGSIEVIGWDIDPLAIAMADFVLQYESLEWGGRLKFKNTLKDSLANHESWPKSDAIFMNPPYISWSLMTSEQRDQVISIMGTSATYRPNIAAIFYYIAAQSLKDRGCIGSLMPTAFLTTESSREIRKKSNELVRPTLICNLGGFIFVSAMADVSIIVSSNDREVSDVQMVWTKNRDDVAPIALQELKRANDTCAHQTPSTEYNIYKVRFEELHQTDNWKCLSGDSFRLRQKTLALLDGEGYASASGLFDIRQGARTGANSVFIISSDFYHHLPKAERQYFRPSVDNASIQFGKLTKTNYLFYPYDSDGITIHDEESLKKLVHTFYSQRLLPNQEKLTGRSKIDPTKWWALTWPRNWQFSKHPKMVSTEFGKSGSFAYDDIGDYVVERGLVWIPKNNKFNRDDYYRYIALMNTPFFDKLLELFSSELVGGVYNLETQYMESIPLPLFNQLDENLSDMLYDYGRQMSGGKPVRMDLLDKIVRDVYGER